MQTLLNQWLHISLLSIIRADLSANGGKGGRVFWAWRPKVQFSWTQEPNHFTASKALNFFATTQSSSTPVYFLEQHSGSRIPLLLITATTYQPYFVSVVQYLMLITALFVNKSRPLVSIAHYFLMLLQVLKWPVVRIVLEKLVLPSHMTTWHVMLALCEGLIPLQLLISFWHVEEWEKREIFLALSATFKVALKVWIDILYIG